MAIGKPRGKAGIRPVFVYLPKDADPTYLRSIGLTEEQIARAGSKIYVGSRKTLRGPGGAQELEREKHAEFAGAPLEKPGEMLVRTYAAAWLEDHHGKDTRRPAETTHDVNAYNLRAFLERYGDRLLDGGIKRGEALAWGRKNGSRARTVSAMFNDAIDDELAKKNPFANRRNEQPRGRKDIVPITEAEVDALARIALDMWGERGLGRTVKAMILFGAWVGCRPGETWNIESDDLNFDGSEVTIRRVKKRGGAHPVDVVAFPRIAQDAIRGMSEIPTSGPIFRSPQGLKLDKGTHRYLWDPVRKAFELTLTPERRVEIRAGRPDIDFYELRHVCASVMADRGLSARDIAHQLGNSVKVCEATYIHTYRDRANTRVKAALDQSAVVDLAEVRERMGNKRG